MTFWSLFWWQWLAWLVGFSGVGSVITLIAWKLWNPKTLISNFAFSTWRMFLWNAVNVGKKVGFAFLFGLIGWGAHELYVTRGSYSKAFATWKENLPNYEKAAAEYQRDYAAWKARAAKENK